MVARVLALGNNNYNNDLNGNNNLNNNARFVGITQAMLRFLTMKSYDHLWESFCSYENLELAHRKSRKGKTLKPYVLEFEKNLKENLLQLRTELLLHSYRPKPSEIFIIRDPKTRKISKSAFRDRVVHHALCNIIEPIFERSFIYDSYANRKGKGTLKALQRFDEFKRKVTRNNHKEAFVLKADIKHYFDTVDQNILLDIVMKKIRDQDIIRLIGTILKNFQTKEKGIGMPLGNLTSQFFANVYLNELDYFVKEQLKAKYYIRYVDDFVILDDNKEVLECYKQEIDVFLQNHLDLELHPSKSTIRLIKQGVTFLGFRVFNHHRLLKKKNIWKMKRKLSCFKEWLNSGLIDYEKVGTSLEGWLAYAHQANTFKLRRRFINQFEELFLNEIKA